MRDTFCPRCERAAAAAAALPGTRLGKHERWLLLYATTTGSPFAAAGTPAEQSARRRALATLRGKGLVFARPAGRVTLEERPELAFLGRRWMRPRLLYRTRFADELVQRYRQELETGKALRWDERVQQALAAAVAACPHRR